MSLDGFVSDTTGSLAPFMKYAGPNDLAAQIIVGIRAIPVGRRTYDTSLKQGGTVTVPGFIVTRRVTPRPAAETLPVRPRSSRRRGHPKRAAQGRRVVLIGPTLAAACL